MSEFLVVDDFNSREMKNRIGAIWEIERTPPNYLEFDFITKDAFQEGRGHSLLLKASLAAGGEAALKSSLKGLDASRAGALVFKCRIQPLGEKEFSGRFLLALRDLHGRSASYDFTSHYLAKVLHPNGWWKEIVLPRSFFSATDWDQLETISFVIRASEKPLRVQMIIDGIAFYGKKDLRFESQKDNLVGFPKSLGSPQRAEALSREQNDKKFLYEVARDTWNYFENALDRYTRLPVDHIRVGAPGDVGSYTTPTNLAMYLLAYISAYELGFISRKEAITKIREVFKTLRIMKRWKGFYYNFYHTTTLQVTRNYISTVDSGWLAAAWIIVRQAFPKELGGIATRFLEEIDFYELYDPEIGQLRLGFDEALNDFSPYHYGLLATEARTTSLIGIGKGDLPREHWWLIYRIPPKSWRWQTQIPETREVEIDQVSFHQGTYDYHGKKFVPSWGGSLFEFLMPTLVTKEKELAPKGLGLNNQIATSIHIDYSLNQQRYPVWGISPASTASGRQWLYRELGVRSLGVKGYRDEGIIAPYASFLALETLPQQAIDNLRQMIQLQGVYGEYGFYDSVNVRTGQVNFQYLVLDQGMSLAALCNYLKGGMLKEYFHRDEFIKRVEDLLVKEEFPI